MKEALQDIFTKIDNMSAEGRHEEAIGLLEEAACGGGKGKEPGPRERAALLNELGGIFRGLGRQEESLKAFLEAEAAQRGEAEGGADYATTLNNLAGTYRLLGLCQQAEAFFRQALGIYEAALGQNHFLYASALNNLGLLFQDMKRYEEATHCHLRAIEILKENASNPVEYATAWHNLGLCMYAIGDYGQAFTFLDDALALYREHAGQGHRLYQDAARQAEALRRAAGMA